ncbi:hypothetical protein GQR58_007061 [Nymphon striatum]|nr:hypothetical protein GQR58_007061 [Nymphon striatum]
MTEAANEFEKNEEKKRKTEISVGELSQYQIQGTERDWENVLNTSKSQSLVSVKSTEGIGGHCMYLSSTCMWGLIDQGSTLIIYDETVFILILVGFCSEMRTLHSELHWHSIHRILPTIHISQINNSFSDVIMSIYDIIAAAIEILTSVGSKEVGRVKPF